jgi:hypothetical protein
MDRKNVEQQTSMQHLESNVDRERAACLPPPSPWNFAQRLHNGNATWSALKDKHLTHCDTVNVFQKKQFMACSVNLDKLETIALLTLIALMDLPV